jgi:hypothetical protein
MAIRAFGVVPVTTQQEPSRSAHRKTLLYDGEGIHCFKMLVSGLKAYLPQFKKEKSHQWTVTKLSNVVALYAEIEPFCVVKAYDYRIRALDLDFREGDRRLPNIDWVRKFIDPDAVLIKPVDDLC